jgi:two-component system phosphate regulon response regulator OmpR
MLTGMDSVTDRVVGLEMGADDYLTKPFAPTELRSRVKAVLRRSMTSIDPVLGRPASRVRVGGCVLDIEMRALFDLEGNEVSITSMEFDMLHTFVSHARRVLTRDQLLEMAHHQKWDPFDRSVDIRVGRLRRKIGDDPNKPRVLKTVRGQGYILIPEGE